MADFLCVLIEDFFPPEICEREREREKKSYFEIVPENQNTIFFPWFINLGGKKKERIKTRHETAILVMFLAGNN